MIILVWLTLDVMEGGSCFSNMLLIRGNVHVSTIINNHPAMESLKIWSVVVIAEMAAILFRCLYYMMAALGFVTFDMLFAIYMRYTYKIRTRGERYHGVREI